MSKNPAVVLEQKTFVSSYPMRAANFSLALSLRIGAASPHISLSFSDVGNDPLRLRHHWTKVQYTPQ